MRATKVLKIREALLSQRLVYLDNEKVSVPIARWSLLMKLNSIHPQQA